MLRVHMAGILVITVALLGIAPACQQQPRTETRLKEEGTLRNAYAEALKAAQAKDVERVLSFYADDASLLSPGAPIATGKPAIRTVWSRMAADPGLAMSAQLIKLEVAHEGGSRLFLRHI